MSYSFIGLGSTKAFSGTNTGLVTVPTSPQTGDLLVATLGFESVASGSAPYVSSSDFGGWNLGFYQDPSATGSGMEVWWARWGSGAANSWTLGASLTGVARIMSFRHDTITDRDPETASASQQQTGDNPVCPAITTLYKDALVVGFAAHTLSGLPGFQFPSPYTEEVDNTRAGFGTVEITNGYYIQPAQGDSGTISLTATASPSTAKGVTGTMRFDFQSFVPQIYRRR